MKKNFIQKLFRYFNRSYLDLLLTMAKNQIKIEYKNALLGMLWTIINPLLQMLVIGIIFQFVLKIKTDNYFAFLFSGLLPWNFFSYSVIRSTGVIVRERNLIQKSSFPRELLVLSLLLANGLNLLISLGLFIIVLFFIYQVNILNFIVVLPIALTWLFILTAGISFIFSALNVRFRDLNFISQAVMPLWFYATPVIYKLQMIPANLELFLYLNPLTGLMQAFRFSLLGEPPGAFGRILINFLISLLIFTFGVWIFRKKKIHFSDWI